MYFNPRIEAWLYKVTKTSSPEYKSDLHATNGNNKKKEEQDYEKVPSDDEDENRKTNSQDEKESVEKDGCKFGM